MSRRAAIWLISGVMLGSTALTGCAHIPTSGPITQDEQVQASIDEPLIRVLARGPQPGLSPEQVVEGFISAEASFEDDHGTARQYLTDEASAAWDPNAGVVVIDDAPAPDFEQFHHVVKMTANEVAFIGADGSLEPRSGGAFHDHFVLQRSDGEWRIAQLRDGLYLTRLDVARTYRSFALHFLAPSQQRLVPDPVFVPVDQSGAATSLVRSLLDGPTRWLAPAVQTAVPAGTELVVDSVPIENGVAQVDLSAQALTADDLGREQLAAQLTWTL
ncbi:MAG TPA: GerMN domain-containing protein, partial [Actinomycetes bacterium]|nr:GerMN domain-containing protein [Actinomycetes bacterium]